MLRISTTTLDSFRLFCQPDQEWMTEEALVDSIRGAVTETPELLIGRAFDRIVERPTTFRVSSGYRCGDYFFPDAVIAPALGLFAAAGVWQVRGQKVYGDAVVVGKADYMLGTEVTDNKTTFSAFAFEKYAEAYQWRFYLDMFEARQMTYHVFCLGEDKRSGEIGLKSTETFRLYPYDRMHADCHALVDRFVTYVRRRGLDALLMERQRQADASVSAA